MTLRESNLPLYQSVMLAAITWAESRSKDPNSKVGACIYDGKTGGLYLGYNGFPTGIPDDDELWGNVDQEADAPCKYDLVVHAEVNAVRKAMQAGVDLSRQDVVLFSTHHPCAACMKDVVGPSGLKEVWYLNDTYRSFTPRVRMICEFIAFHLDVQIRKLEMRS